MLKMKIELQMDGSWLASDSGYDRPILAEGNTRKQAEDAAIDMFGNQYAAAQAQTHFSLVRDGDL
jgi:hypothetical protein